MTTLITIPFSHFCEKARWSLDVAGVDYTEEGHCPALHRRAVRRVGGTRSVPVLVLDDGTVIDDSPAIVKLADARAPADRKLLPAEGSAREEVLAFERRLDTEYAPAVRLFAYHHLLPDRKATLRLVDLETPRVERIVVRLAFPLLRRLMRRFMRIDEGRALESRDLLRRVLDEVGDRLKDGRPYLMGDRFGAADIAFAAFSAPLLAPLEHPRRAPGFEVDALPAPFADEVRRARATPAGQFVERLYREKRRRH